jgi:predicted kinase
MINQQRKKPFREVIIVSGAPGSGKTTYVNKVKRPGDLIVDMDALYAAISGLPVHSADKTVLDIALQIRECLYDAIENPIGSNWRRAFVITASPRRSEINELKKRLNASEVMMTTGRSTCIAQIKNDPTRKGREDEFIAIASQWYDEMEGRY